MNVSRTSWVRFFLALVGALVLALAQTLHQRAVFDRDIEAFKGGTLVEYLRKVFPEQLFGDQWGAAPDKTAIQERIVAFNERHWPVHSDGDNSLRIRVTRAGPVRIDDPEIEGGKPLSIQLASGPSPVDIHLVAEVRGGLTACGIAVASIYFLAAFALAWFFPVPATFNAFPLARDMALIFDRKVSAGQSWGMYRLSHLGGGGALPGIPENDFEACNDEALRVRCFMAVQSTYETLRANLEKAITDPDLRCEFRRTMEEGFGTARRRIRDDAPRVEDDDDVGERFWPFVRHDLFGFAVLHLENRARMATQVGLEPSAVTVERPPVWLIGGYEVYYPSSFFERLVNEIRAGLVSACNEAFDSLHIFADAQRLFISIDFHCSGLAITPQNEDHLSAFLRTPFEGGLKRICTLMDGFGEVSLFDSRVGFQLSQRKRCTERTDTGLTVRLDFRRIRPSELDFVRKRFPREGN